MNNAILLDEIVFLDMSDAGLSLYDSYVHDTKHDGDWYCQLSHDNNDPVPFFNMSISFAPTDANFDQPPFCDELVPCLRVTENEAVLRSYFTRIWESLAQKLGLNFIVEDNHA